MKRAIAFLLGLCMMLMLMTAGAEETAAGDCSGRWYFVYSNVTLGELALNADGSYRMELYSQDAEDEGSWVAENGSVMLTSREGDETAYTYDGTQLVPEGMDIGFAIRREPGRITDGQLNAYVQDRTLPEGMTEEEMQEIIREVYNTADADAREENTYGDFAGVWVNDGNGYLTIWGKNIAAAFPIDGELTTGFYGNPGEWSKEGNALVNSDGTILVMRNDGTMLVSEQSGTYTFRKVFSPSTVSIGTDAGVFAGGWKSIGILVTDASGVKIFTPIAGYDLKITEDRIYTLFGDETGAYPYEVVPESGRLMFADGGSANEYVLYEDDTIRWVVTDSITLIFQRADEDQIASLYKIAGPGYVPAGSTITYTVDEPDGGRTFIWSAEGEGVAIDPATGALTVAEGTAAGTPYTVTASPADGGMPVTLTGTVCNSILGEETFESVSLSYSRGFAIPKVTSWSAPETAEDKASATIQYRYQTEQFTCEETCSFIQLGFFPDAMAYYGQISENLMKNGNYPDLAEKTTEINGNPAYMLCFRSETGSEATETAGFIYIVREDTVLVITILCADSSENPARVTLNDLEKIVEQITYDPEKAPLRKADGELSVTVRGNPQAVTAGKTLAFTAAFANPAAVKREKADAVTWSVTDPATGNTPEGITVDGKGVLKIDRGLAETVRLEVTVVSEKFGTKASYPIIAVPVIKKLTAEPGEVMLYAIPDETASVQITADPAITLDGLEWTMRPNTMAEVIPGENGAATLKALAAGKGTLTVKEPGGRTATVRVTVLQPVESVELKATGKAVPGGNVIVSATIQPKNAGDKKTAWSLDVGEDIATVDARGRVRINRDTPAGTVITVTCTAEGAKVPVVQTIQIEVAEK